MRQVCHKRREAEAAQEKGGGPRGTGNRSWLPGRAGGRLPAGTNYRDLAFALREMGFEPGQTNSNIKLLF